MKLHGDNACKYLGFEKYDFKTDKDKPVMFWLYDEDSYKLLAQHTGKKYVCWHNQDVVGLGSRFAKYITVVRNPEIVHICLNHVLEAELLQLGIYAMHHYIFWGDVSKYKPENVLTKDCYMCSNPGRGVEYGEMIFNGLAWKYKDWTFHVFGINPTIPVYCDNVKYYGWIPEDEMDDITKNFGLCLRYNFHDGFPQVICKALLRDHFVITKLHYDDLTLQFNDLRDLYKHFDSVNKNIELGCVHKNMVKGMINNFNFINV
jgi:hypothetical protein